MCLIEDHIIPRFAFEDVLIFARKCVRRYTDVEIMLVEPPSTKLLAPLTSSMVTKYSETGQELLKFHLPVQKNAGGDDNKVGTPNSMIASKVRKQCNRLDRFTVISVRGFQRD